MSSYTTIAGDTWDLIAYKIYGDAYQMSALLSANLAYRQIVIFDAGVVLSVPTLPPATATVLPPWKQS